MFKGIVTIIACALLLSPALAKGPVQPAPEDVGFGPADPILNPWPTSDQIIWTEVGTAPQSIGHSGSGVLGNYMYNFGCVLGNFAQAFNLTTEEWEASTPAPLGYDNWCGVAVPPENAIYLVGRYWGAYADEIQKFTPEGGGPLGTWTLVAPQPTASCGAAAAWDGGDYIYAAGGGPGSLTVTRRYSISQDAWEILAPMPIGRAYCGGAYLNGKFYVFGGTVAAAANTIVAYDPGTNAWDSTLPNLPANVWIATFSSTFNEEYVMSVGGGSFYMGSQIVQLFDPVTNTWSLETPLPMVTAGNSARYVGSGIVISAGGYTGTYTGITYRGNDFPGSAPDVTITMTPITPPPIQIPAIGGSFDFNVALANNETAPQNFDAWIMVQLPNGTWYGPVLGPLDLTVPGSTSVNRDRVQSVPARAPSRMYLYEGRAGDYPNDIWDTDSFTFEKLTTGESGTPVSGWENYGECFESWMTSLPDAEIPAEFTLQGAYPNPFNLITTLSFSLPQAGWVRVEVFDMAGRMIGAHSRAPLQYDAGTHSITFDGSNLPSGIYFARMEAGNSRQVQKLILLK